MARPLLIGYGNPGRGDDALGPLLVQRLDGAPRKRHDAISCFQLQPELVFDLVGRPLVLLADASLSAPAPFTFARLEASRTTSHSSHQMDPGTLLYLHETVLQRSPPPCFMLSIRGERFPLGEGLSTEARRNLERAVRFATNLLDGRTATPAPRSSSSGSPRESSRWNAPADPQTAPARTPSDADR